MQNYESFAKELSERPELYDSYRTFYIRMKNAGEETRRVYNTVKNTIMSYVSKVDKDESVKVELEPHGESFVIKKEIVAKFVMAGGQLCIHLKVDPQSQDKRKAMFKTLSEQTILYKLGKGNVIEQVLDTIPKMMSAEGFTSNLDYIDEDYASFFTTESEDENVATIIESSQKEFEENEAPLIEEETASEEETEPEASEPESEEDEEDEEDEEFDFSELDYDEYRRLYERRRVVPEGMPTKEELKKEEKELKEQKRRQRRPKLFQELANYGYDFLGFKMVSFYLVTIIIGIAISIAYQLKLVWAIILIAGLLAMMPTLVRSYFLKQYEEKRYHEVTTYMEQMLYSFRKNSKIIASLRDALTVFPEHTRMHDTLIKAIYYIQTTTTDADLYANALSIIEKEYPCRRIRSLHRYMIKVEGVGGDHTMGVEALLKDRRMWVERADAYRKDAASVLADIYISIGFSAALACIIVRLMSTPMVDIPSNLLYQVSSVVFLLIAALTICLTMKRTILSLDDGETEVSSKKIISKMNWLRSFDAKKEMKNSIILAAIFSIFIVVGLVSKNILLIIGGAGLVIYALFLSTPIRKRSSTKAVCRAIEKVYPDWLLELALLLQTNNLHVAIEATLETAPLILKGDLTQLDKEILENPSGIEPFADFLDFLPLHSVQSSMLLLYSIFEFGQEDGNFQLMELVERNSIMMDKAEQYRNDDRLSATFIFKFIPMGISALKLMLDLVVMLLSYFSVLG